MFCHEKSVFVMTNMCHDKHNFVSTKVCLSRQKLWSRQHYVVSTRRAMSQQTHVCHDKHTFVMTMLYLSIYVKHNFVMRNILSWQTSFRDKGFVMTKVCSSWQIFLTTNNFVLTNVFLATKHTFCHDKSRLVYACLIMTNIILSRQSFVMTKVCFSWEIFVTRNTCLSRQTRVCRDVARLASNMCLL